MFSRLRIVWLTLALVLGAPLDAAERTVAIDVPAGEADAMLKIFARQADVQLIFDARSVVGMRTHGVRGKLSPASALQQMLAGLPLVWVADSITGAFAIRKKRGDEITESGPQRVLHSAPDQTGSGRPNPESPMNAVETTRASSLSRWTRIFTLLGLLIGKGASAQSAASPTPTDSLKPAGELVVLSPFTVSSNPNDDRYAPSEATYGGRQSVNLFTSPNTISVISSELLQDVAPSRVLDATKYISGVSENIIPNGLDFITVRGFTVREQMVDGLASASQLNQEPAIIERIEVSKGPNAILTPTSSPGGTINAVSKKPRFINSGSLSFEVGRFEGNRVVLDLERIASQNTSVRIIATGNDAETYVGAKQRGWTVMPMIAHRFSRDTQVTIQALVRDGRMQNYMGLPIDPRSGPLGDAQLIGGVDRFANLYGDNFRAQRHYQGRVFFTSNLSEVLSMRLVGSYNQVDLSFQQNQPFYPLWGAINPRTGLFTPGIAYGPAPDFTPTPLTTNPPRVLSRGGRYFYSPQPIHSIDIQNDYNLRFEKNGLKFETTFGYAFNHFDQMALNWSQTKPAIDFDNITPSVINAAATNIAVTQNAYNVNDRHQLYISQSLSAWEGRLFAQAGVSYTNYQLKTYNYLNNTAPISEPQATDKVLGLSVKPRKNVVLFYNYSESSASIPPANIGLSARPLQIGKQNEGGVRVSFFQDRLKATATRFEIQQDNNAITDPRNTAFPPPNPLFPPILSDRVAKGWELELVGSLTERLSVIGNYTKFTNRNNFNVPFSNAAEESWALLARYEFDQSAGPLRGLSVSLGANYLARRPGDTATGLAAGSTPEKPVPNLPTFFLDARTLVDASLAYKFSKTWSAQLNVENLLDTEYLTSSESRQSVWPGVPLNARLRVTYSF